MVDSTGLSDAARARIEREARRNEEALRPLPKVFVIPHPDQGDRMALYDQHPQYTGGEIAIHGQNIEPVEVPLTPAVRSALAPQGDNGSLPSRLVMLEGERLTAAREAAAAAKERRQAEQEAARLAATATAAAAAATSPVVAVQAPPSLSTEERERRMEELREDMRTAAEEMEQARQRMTTLVTEAEADRAAAAAARQEAERALAAATQAPATGAAGAAAVTPSPTAVPSSPEPARGAGDATRTGGRTAAKTADPGKADSGQT